MMKVRKTVWRSGVSRKDLLSWEPRKISVLCYDLNLEEARDLIEALEEVIQEATADPESLLPLTPKDPPAASATSGAV